MSLLDRYATRFWWNGHRGAAKDHGKDIALLAPPVLTGMPGRADLVVVRIDYIPFLIQTVMPQFEAERDLWSWEVAAVERLLREMTA